MSAGSRTIERVYDLTPTQRAVLAQSLADPSGYVVQKTIVIEGEFEADAARRAAALLAVRHEILRASIYVSEEGRMKHVVLRDRIVEVRVVPAGESAGTLAEFTRGFELKRDSLVRLLIVSERPGVVRLVWTFHHIVLDGWSLGVLTADLFDLHDALVAGHRPEPLPAPPFGDHVEWLRSRDERGARDFWRAELADAAPVPSFPYVRQDFASEAPAQRMHEAVSRDLADSTVDRLTEFVAETGLTRASVLQFVWALLLARESGTRDLLIGRVVSGRDPSRDRFHEGVGMYVNTVPTRIRFDAQDTLLDAMRRMSDLDERAHDHCHLPWSNIRKELHERAGLAALFVMENYPLRRVEVSGRPYRVRIENQPEFSELPLTLGVTLFEGCSLSFGFDGALLDRRQAERISHRYVALLDAVLADPTQTPDAVRILPPSETAEVTRLAVGPRIEPPGLSLSGRLLRHIRQHPERDALVQKRGRLSYGDLGERLSAVGALLDRWAVPAGARVLVVGTNSVETIATAIGVAASGRSFVMVEAEAPAARTAVIAREADAAGILMVHPPTQPLNRLVDGIPVAIPEDFLPLPAAGNADLPDLPCSADREVYAIFTSGSTGVPKGVPLLERGVLNLANELSRLVLTEWKCATVGLLASIAFDASLQQIFGALLNGHTLHVIPPALKHDPVALWRYLDVHAIDVIDGTPSFWGLMLGQLEATEHRHRPSSILIGGERVPGALLAGFARHLQQTTLYNVYGLSETTVDSTLHRCTAEDVGAVDVPVGRPLAHTDVAVRHRDGDPCGIGVLGAVHISGVGVAHGYLGEAREQRFVRAPETGLTTIDTGDLGYWGEDGLLRIVGRSDDQVKINGHRIEPGEVEQAVLTLDVVTEAAVVTDTSGGDVRLVAYIVANGPWHIAELREQLARRLPAYMVPQRIIGIAAIPRSTSGKTDRAALRKLVAQDSQDTGAAVDPADSAGPPTGSGEVLLEVVARVLGRPDATLDDDFFSLGGDSIEAIRVVALLSEYTVTVADILRRPVLRDLAREMQKRSRVIDQRPLTGTVPAFPIHDQLSRVTTTTNAHHFNQSLLFEVREPLSQDAVQQAARALAGHHDALRARFAHGERDLVIGQPEDADPIIREICVAESQVEEQIRTIQGALVPAAGSPLAVALLHTPSHSLLLVVVHHSVCDAVSLRVIAEDLEVLLVQGIDDSLPPRTDSLRTWQETLTAPAATARFDSEEDFWRAQLPTGESRRGAVRPRPVAQTAVCDRTLGGIEIDAGVQSALERHGLSMQSLLTAVFSEAYGHVTGQTGTTLLLEGHGRSLEDSDVNVSRTVGWFTAPHPLQLPGARRGRLTLDDCAEVHRRIADIPNGGLGFAWRIWPRLSDEERSLLNAASPIFNYLGDTGSGAAETGRLLVPASHRPVGEVADTVIVENPFIVNVWVDAGRVVISIRHTDRFRWRGRARRLLRRMEATLRALLPRLADHPVGDSIRALIAGGRAATEGLVSVLNPDGDIDLFAFPPAMLRVAYLPFYEALFSSLGRYRVHVLHLPDEGEPEDVFAGYVTSVVGADLPFAFVGYSGGSNIAYETARVLESSGQAPRRMLFLDGFKWQTGLDFQILDDDTVDDLVENFLRELGVDDRTEAMATALQVLEVEREAFLAEGRRYHAYAISHQNRTERLSGTRIVNLLSQERVEGDGETRHSWQPVTAQPVEYLQGHGTHLTMLTDPRALKDNTAMVTETLDSWRQADKTAQPVVSAAGISRVYGSGSGAVRALDCVNLELHSRELVVVLGSSGSGKSTLLNIVSTLDAPDEGTVTYFGSKVDFRKARMLRGVRREHIGFVFQSYNLVPTLAARDNILLGGDLRRSAPELDTLAQELGITNLLDKFPTELSGGEQQRVAIARALLKRPAVLFCDEPTGALDTENSKAVLRLLCAYRDTHGTAIVMVTHNPQIAELADRVLTMRDGRILAEARADSPASVDDIVWV